jgi:hypothetical protein
MRVLGWAWVGGEIGMGVGERCGEVEVRAFAVEQRGERRLLCSAELLEKGLRKEIASYCN